MNLKHIRELGDLAKTLRLTVDRIERGKHFKVYLDTPQGKKLLVVSRTASDFRAIRNNRSLLRQWANSQGESK